MIAWTPPANTHGHRAVTASNIPNLGDIIGHHRRTWALGWGSATIPGGGMTAIPLTVTSKFRGPRQARSVIEFTTMGWLVCAAIPGFASTIFWQQQPTGLYIAGALSLSLMASYLWCRKIIEPVHGQWLLPPHTHAGNECTVGCLLSASHPRGPLTLAASKHSDDGHIATVSGVHTAPTRLLWTTRFNQRGLQALPQLEVTTTRPFGLLRARRRCGKSRDLLVLPALGKVRPEAMLQIISWLDSGYLPRDPGSDEVAHLRPYRRGDSMRAIHWRATAKMRAIMVTERHAPRARHIAIVIDHAGPQRHSPRFERLISAAATVIVYLSQQGWQVSLHGDWLPGSGVAGNSNTLLEHLAVVECKPHAQVINAIPRSQPSLLFTLNSDLRLPETLTAQCIDLPRAEQLVRLGRHIR